MKNILLAAAVATIAACGHKTNESVRSELPIVPVHNDAILADTAKSVTFYEPAGEPKSRPKAVRTKSRQKAIPAEARALPTETTPAENTHPVETSPVVTAPATPSADVNIPSSSAGTDNSAGNKTGQTVPQPEEKKGWSKAARGAVIGAGAGAIGGAIISKKKGKGALIGGILGAAGGYVIGRGMDKKDNRITDN